MKVVSDRLFYDNLSISYFHSNCFINILLRTVSGQVDITYFCCFKHFPLSIHPAPYKKDNLPLVALGHLVQIPNIYKRESISTWQIAESIFGGNLQIQTFCQKSFQTLCEEIIPNMDFP